MSSQRIKTFLEALCIHGEERYDLVQALREVVLALDDSITEEIKYGGLLFSAGKPFCGIFSYAKHVSLEFSEGAVLPDPHRVLEGEGKFRRHIKLLSQEEIHSKHIPEYLALAFKAAGTN
ncbi:DUF1801 domain-containing protein [Chlorobium sp. BLA1]|uniref:DUF1801 domain-containing protein n=1 Tax=Candidatus Chlorobium masyuteum TaxID=2716876 RepID=UPI00141F5DDF|nr:DUF1801 domain-containing protein [Candidatus Chlorobium masyuteum]NHQ59405.1 DUF1801 domain-containing protein [Candidatus Chlorobium masyuteum]NTU45722.1 DUF1801 domain-containing protein [Chlorobiaceae bacterium]